MDRLRCPLHGKIIPRDNMGNPSKEDDKKYVKERKEDDWQDPELLRNDEFTSSSIIISFYRKM